MIEKKYLGLLEKIIFLMEKNNFDYVGDLGATLAQQDNPKSITLHITHISKKEVSPLLEFINILEYDTMIADLQKIEICENEDGPYIVLGDMSQSDNVKAIANFYGCEYHDECWN